MNRFAICQAFQQLEADYNVGGLLIERPSNMRRRESVACQLARIGFHNPYSWVDIPAEPQDTDEHEAAEIRDVYMRHVLAWGLPIDADLMRAIKRTYVAEFVARHPQCAGDDYLQGH